MKTVKGVLIIGVALVIAVTIVVNAVKAPVKTQPTPTRIPRAIATTPPRVIGTWPASAAESVPRTMYVCTLDRCKNSGTYGQNVAAAANVWSGYGEGTARGQVLRKIPGGTAVKIKRSVQASSGAGGLWYELEDGGWMSDLWLTPQQCTPRNRSQDMDC